jgi:hypothetical protein
MTKNWVTDDDANITLASFYGWDLKPDPKAVKDREKKIAKIKAEMGDKYRLAKPVERVEE